MAARRRGSAWCVNEVRWRRSRGQRDGVAGIFEGSPVILGGLLVRALRATSWKRGDIVLARSSLN